MFNRQKKNILTEGYDHGKLVKETAETFNPAKNPYVNTGLVRLLNMGGMNPPMDLTPKGELPGWKNNYKNLFD